ncbi:MAG: hypothetical protein M3Q23_10710 [Actinomycetota bacterium]|nr:hypothetical protein [Actinomycetota bacterium]
MAEKREALPLTEEERKGDWTREALLGHWASIPDSQKIVALGSATEDQLRVLGWVLPDPTQRLLAITEAKQRRDHPGLRAKIEEEGALSPAEAQQWFKAFRKLKLPRLDPHARVDGIYHELFATRSRPTEEEARLEADLERMFYDRTVEFGIEQETLRRLGLTEAPPHTAEETANLRYLLAKVSPEQRAAAEEQVRSLGAPLDSLDVGSKADLLVWWTREAPSTVGEGQALVLRWYEAYRAFPDWFPVRLTKGPARIPRD